MGNICKIMKEIFLPEEKQSQGIFFMTCRCAKGWDSGLVGRTDSSLRSHFILKLPIKWCWCFSRNAQSAKQRTSQHGGEWHIAMETKLLCCASLFKMKSAVCLLNVWINVSTLQPITDPPSWSVYSALMSQVRGEQEWRRLSPLWSFPYCTSTNGDGANSRLAHWSVSVSYPWDSCVYWLFL